MSRHSPDAALAADTTFARDAAPFAEASFEADMAACRKLLKSGSRSFHAASFLLPDHARNPATALYAFCRLADDAVDEGDGSPDVIAMLTERVNRIYAHDPLPHAADRAFAYVARQFALPRATVDALIEGFAWDLQGRRYHSFADLQGYGARVAGCVGIMMTTVMGRRGSDVLARAADLGVAMQLTNIARDVGEDARNGRLYLPLDWLEEAGIDAGAFLANPVFTPALGQVVQRLLAEAETLYTRADAGIPLLPARCRSGIRAARLIYAEIGHEVARNGFDSVSRRAVVPFAAKLPLLARTLLPALPAQVLAMKSLAALPPLGATAFLVEAVLMMTPPKPSVAMRPARPAMPPWWDLAGRFTLALSVLEKLERNERMGINRASART